MTTDITELAQKPTRYGTNSQGVFTNQTDGAYVSYLDFVALVEALEKAQGMETYWKTQCRGITDHCEELQARIAGLESRTVKLPAERFCPAEYAGSQLWSETEVWNKAITACADALRADGIKVEAE